jgi:nicotinamidase/pyrazinamidase
MKWVSFVLLWVLAAAQKRALLIIDVQHDFLPGGSLAVPSGEEVIPIINSIRKTSSFDLVVFTQDWHTPAHVSFASSHSGMQPFSIMELSYKADGSLCSGPNISPSYSVACATADIATRLNQTLWPDHCVQDSNGAQLHQSLLRTSKDLIVRKGYHVQIDSYSAFWDNGHVAATELHPLLQSYNITQIFVTGLALDFCVFATALDGPPSGYETFVVLDAARGISAEGMSKAVQELVEHNITVLNASAIPIQSCEVIKKMPGCSVAMLNDSQRAYMLNELCDRFNRNYTVDPEWCTNTLDGAFKNCSSDLRIDYALSAWAFFASECCAPLQDFGSCTPLNPVPMTAAPSNAAIVPTNSAPPTAVAPTMPDLSTPTVASPTQLQILEDDGFGPTAIIAGMAVVVVISILVAFFLYWRGRRRRSPKKDLFVPLVDKDFSSI